MSSKVCPNLTKFAPRNMPTPRQPVYVFGEAMIELSGVDGDTARLGVAGDTFNTAVYLSRSGVKSRYVTALGDDNFSLRILSALRGEDIFTSGCVIIPGMAPGLYAIDVDDEGERSFTYWRSNSAARQFFDRPESMSIIKHMKHAETLYLSGITLSIFGAKDRGKIIDIARSIKNAGGQVVFDTNYRPRGWQSQEAAQRAVNALMPYVCTALVTWEDEQGLFGDETPEACAARWHQAGASEVIVKAGPRGAYCQDTGWVPPPNVIKPVDTTGAGDSFNGAYLAARLSGANIKQGILRGHELAAKVLMTPGAILENKD